MENIQRYFFIVKIVLYSKKIDVILSLNQLEHKSEIKDLVELTFLEVLVQKTETLKTSHVRCPIKSKSCILLDNRIKLSGCNTIYN